MASEKRELRGLTTARNPAARMQELLKKTGPSADQQLHISTSPQSNNPTSAPVEIPTNTQPNNPTIQQVHNSTPPHVNSPTGVHVEMPTGEQVNDSTKAQPNISAGEQVNVATSPPAHPLRWKAFSGNPGEKRVFVTARIPPELDEWLDECLYQHRKEGLTKQDLLAWAIGEFREMMQRKGQ